MMVESVDHKRAPALWRVRIGLFLWGAVAGFASALIVPHRLIATRIRIPGTSLIFAPLIAGAVMNWFGEHRRAKGRATSGLATFAGGAVFAFGMALARFLMVALK